MSRTRDKDGGWAWVVLCACSVCVFMTSGLAMLAGIFQKVFLEDFGGDVVMTSWITSLFASFMQLTGPVTGVVVSVFSCRVSVMVGAGLLTAGLLVSAFCESPTALLLSFGLSSGLGLGLIYSAAIVMVNVWFVRYRPVAVGSVLGAGGLGIMAMPVLCQFLLASHSSRHALAIMAALSAQLIVAGALLFPVNDGTASAKSWCGTVLNCCRTNTNPGEEALPHKEASSGKSPPPDNTRSADAKDSYETKPLQQDSAYNQQGSEYSEHSEYSEYKPDSQPENKPVQRDHGKQEISKDASSTIACTEDGVVLNDSNTVCEVDRSLLDGRTTLGDKGKTNEDFQEKDSRCREKAEHGQQSRDAESATLLSNSFKSIHSATVMKAALPLSLSGSVRSIDLAFLASSALSMHSKAASASASASAETLPNRRRTLQKLRAVLASPSLVVICLQLFLANAAVGIVLVHFPEFCVQRGSDLRTVSFSFSMNGVTLTLSRFLMGCLAQDSHMDPLAVYVGMALITSCLMVLTPLLAVTAAAQITLLAALGVYSGGSYALLTEITIHCAGVDTLSLAFGMEMISAGLGFLVAPPIAGWLVVLTSSYSNAIFLAGFLSFIAAFVAMVISLTRPVWKPAEHSDVVDNYVTASDADKTMTSTEDKIV